MRFPILGALLCALLIIGCDLYIFFDIRKSAKGNKRKVANIIYILFTLCCWGLIAAILAYPKMDPDVSLVPLMWMLFVVISIYIPKLLYCIFSLIGRLVRVCSGSRIRRNYGAPVGLGVAIVCFLFIWSGALVTGNQIVTNRVDIVSDKLPETFDGLKVLQFSDMHLGTWGSDTTFVSRLVDSVNNLKPDLILFTGDMVSRRSNELDPFVSVLARLKAPMGVIAVHGNHDYASYVKWKDPKMENRDVGRLDSLMRSMGWKVLNNSTEFISRGNDSIVVIGIENWGEPPFKQLGDLGKSYPDSVGKQHGLNDDMFKILLTHNPIYWRKVVTQISNIDLSLAGHTHAMQMMIGTGKSAWSPSKFRYPEWGGLYTDRAKDGTPMNLYVNIGAGEVGYPARFGSAKPELTLFTLHGKQSK